MAITDKKPRIDILLATYNGAPYLREQLDSIIAQRDEDWRLIIRDDGSTDGTVAITSEYATAHPGRIVIANTPTRERGARANFSALGAICDAPYIAFSDQDDVWTPDHLSLLRQRMEEIEQQEGSATPLLVHSDLIVVDAKLVPVAQSFWTYQGLDPHRVELAQLLVQNVITGNTILANRSLIQLALPVPRRAMMHDWWIALVASAFGKISAVSTPTVHYRQHGRNTLGAQPYRKIRLGGLHILAVTVPRYCWTLCKPGKRTGFNNNLRQGRSLLQRFARRLDPKKRIILRDFCRLEHSNWLNRRLLVMRRGFWRNKPSRNIAFFAVI